MKYSKELSLALPHTSSKPIPHLTILHCLVFKEQPSASQAPALAGAPAYESRLVAGGSCKYTTSAQTMQPAIWRYRSIYVDLRASTSIALALSHLDSGLWITTQLSTLPYTPWQHSSGLDWFRLVSPAVMPPNAGLQLRSTGDSKAASHHILQCDDEHHSRNL